MLALGYAMLSMFGVAAIALFLSTFVDSPLAAALGALAVLIASSLLLTLDAAIALQPYLPTRYWLSFVDFFRDPILWRDVLRGIGLQALRRCLPGCGVGQLHDQGHHRLSQRCRAHTSGRRKRRRPPRRRPRARSPPPMTSSGWPRA